jgi:hypothetical protein
MYFAPSAPFCGHPSVKPAPAAAIPPMRFYRRYYLAGFPPGKSPECDSRVAPPASKSIVTTAMVTSRFPGFLRRNIIVGIAILLACTAATARFIVDRAGSFTVSATGSPSPVLSIAGDVLPTWAGFDPVTRALTGTAPALIGSPFTLTISAANGIGSSVTQTFTPRCNQATPSTCRRPTARSTSPNSRA